MRSLLSLSPSKLLLVAPVWNDLVVRTVVLTTWGLGTNTSWRFNQPPPWISTDCWGSLFRIFEVLAKHIQSNELRLKDSQVLVRTSLHRILGLRDFDNFWYYFDYINWYCIILDSWKSLFWLFLHFQAFARFCRPTAGGMACHDVSCEAHCLIRGPVIHLKNPCRSWWERSLSLGFSGYGWIKTCLKIWRFPKSWGYPISLNHSLKNR